MGNLSTIKPYLNFDFTATGVRYEHNGTSGYF